MDFLRENLALVAPLIILQLILIIVALVDLVRREKVTGGNKWVWGVVICLLQYFGPIAYFVFGRKE